MTEERATGDEQRCRGLCSAFWRGHSRAFWLCAAVILLAACATRLWDLGSRPYHHDESIHARTSWDLAMGRGFKYDPVYHGPFLYFLTALTYRLLGDSDYTGRLTPALFGIGLVALILFALPRWIGEAGAVISAALVTASPAMTCYQRYLIHDSYMLVFTLVMILSYLALYHGGSAAYIYPLALTAALGICTKANTYFVLFIIASFDYVAALARCALALGRGAGQPPRKLFWGAVFSVGLFFGAAVGALFAIATQKLVPIVVAVGLALALWALSRALLSLLHHALTKPDERSFLSQNWIFVLEGLVLALVVYSALYTSGFRYRYGFVAGVYETFAYWGGQQQHPRLPGPLIYHFVLLALYELPTALAGIAGTVWALARPTAARTFFAYWAIASLAIYSAANEKVPWLVVHPLLPLAVLGGAVLGAAFEALGRRVAAAREAGKLAPRLVGSAAWGALAFYLLAGLALLGRGAYAILGPNRADSHEPLLYMQAPEEFIDTFRKLDPGPPPEGAINIAIDGSAQWPLYWYLRHRRGVAWYRMGPQEGLELVILDRPDPAFDIAAGYRWREVKLRGWMLFHPPDMRKKQPLLRKIRSELAQHDLRKWVAFVLFRQPLKEPGWTKVVFHYREHLQDRLEG